MVLEHNIPQFSEWLPGALGVYFLVLGILAVVTLAVSWLSVALRSGPIIASETMGRSLLALPGDLFGISPRRVAALAWLVFKESVRSMLVAVVAVFLVILLFAGWFLDPASMDPGRLYMSFVLTFSGWLILLLVLFLSALSLPADIKNKTIYTIVTKPVRASEIVLGRILGFTVVGSILLALFAVVSLIFVERGLSHTHQVQLGDLTADASGTGAAGTWRGVTSESQKHQHKVRIDAAGNATVLSHHGHWHKLPPQDKLAKEGKAEGLVETGGPEGILVARVPVYGQLRFLDRLGKPSDKGINVGDEWTYRGYVEGNTLSAAIWSFRNLREEDFPNGLPVEMTLGVFRTHKGDLAQGIPGSLSVVNPVTGVSAEVKLFRAKKFLVDTQFVPRKIRLPSGEEKDLFRDFVVDGKLEVWLRCLDVQQYLGAGQADMYLRAYDVWFRWNFLKGFYGIWLQMVLTIGVGVMCSTFLGGPIALLSTAGMLLLSSFSQFIYDLATGTNMGGGPVESMIRMVQQDNVVQALEPGLRTTVALGMDWVLKKGLLLISQVLPDFSSYSYSSFVASGFNVDGNLVLTQTVATLGFLGVLFLGGYLLLKGREVAR